MKKFFQFICSFKINHILSTILLCGIIAYIFCLFSPVDTSTIASNQLEAVQESVCFVIAPNGSLIGWGDNEYSLLPGLFGCPYIARKNILKNITSVTCGRRTTMAIDKNGNLWGWGNERFFLCGQKQSLHNSPTLVMQNVKQVTVGNYVAVVKADQSLWIWNKNQEPKKVMDNVSNCFIFNNNIFVVDLNGNLYHWNNALEINHNNLNSHFVLSNVKDVSSAFSYAYQCLTKDGNVFLFDWRDRKLSKIIYQNVDSLCEGGFITKNGQLMVIKWSGEEDNIVSILEKAPNVRCAANQFFYITENGKIHAENTIIPITLRTVSPAFRNLLLLLFMVKLLYWIFKERQRRRTGF